MFQLAQGMEDTSEGEANQIVEQIEETRDRVLSRAKRLKRKAEARLRAMKYQAEELKKWLLRLFSRCLV